MPPADRARRQNVKESAGRSDTPGHLSASGPLAHCTVHSTSPRCASCQGIKGRANGRASVRLGAWSAGRLDVMEKAGWFKSVGFEFQICSALI